MNKSPTTRSTIVRRSLLVILRLAIGWHLFIEGTVKLESMATGPTETNKPFSSRGYLQQAQGPLAPLFRSIAGDPDKELLAKLPESAALAGQDNVPYALQEEWQGFMGRYNLHYQLDPAQRSKAQQLLDKHLLDVGTWFGPGQGGKTVKKDFAFGTITPTLDVPTRIKEYREKVAELREKVDGWNLRFEKDVTKNRVTVLRGEVARLRGELQKDLDERANKLRAELDQLLTKEQTERDYRQYVLRLMKADRTKGNTPEHQALADFRKAVSDARRADLLAEKYPEGMTEGMLADPALRVVLLKICKQNASPPLRMEDTRLIDDTDKIVAWGLTISGVGLLLGCFTRLSCLVGAVLLLLFYLALPPLPGLPDNPMAEGKYLFVNKNLIEAIALLVLATTRSGRWFGLDGVLSWMPPFSWFWPRGRSEKSPPP